MEFDETPRFWYPHVARDVWIYFSSERVELRLSEHREIFFFFSLSFPFLSLSFSLFASPMSDFFLSFSFLAFLLFPFYFLSFLVLSYPTEFSPLSHFFFSFLSFSHSFLFLILFLFSFGLHQPNGPKSGKLPPPSSFATCHSPIFLNFFHFPLFSSCDTWLNVSHLSQFAPTHDYHAMCPTPRVPCGILMIMPCVTRHLMPRKT